MPSYSGNRQKKGAGPCFCLKQERSLISIPLDATSQTSLYTITVLGCFVVLGLLTLWFWFCCCPVFSTLLFCSRHTPLRLFNFLLRCQQVVVPRRLNQRVQASYERSSSTCCLRCSWNQCRCSKTGSWYSKKGVLECPGRMYSIDFYWCWIFVIQQYH